MRSFTFLRCSRICALALFSFSSATGQEQDAISQANNHIMNQRYGPAIRLLEGHLAMHRSSEALLLLARALYWSGNVQAAERRYEEGLRLFPENDPLRVDAGRFFLETGKSDRADEVLRPFETSRNEDGLTLLGTARYWRGDWDAAKEFFERVLVLDPKHSEARRQLSEILSATPSRLALIPESQSDNQPLRRFGGAVHYTVHITPLSPLTAEGGFSSVNVHDTTRTFLLGSLTVRYSLPGGRFAIDLSAGGIRMSSRQSVDWTYRLGAVLRLPQASTLSAHVERRPYFETISSFDVPVSLTSLKFTFDRPESATWIAQASVQSHRYFDGNTGTTIYGWVLFPLSHGKQSTFNLGYGFSLEDTRESRFVADSGQSTGQYHPYYTPINILSHNLLAFLSVPFSASLRVKINGSYGLVGSEEDTRSVSQTIPGPFRPAQEGSKRTFHPWQLRMSMDVHPLESFRFTVEANRQVLAYYQISQLRLVATYTFPVRLR